MSVFLVELVLLAVLAVAGARFGGGALSVVLGVLLPIVVAMLWGLCLSPRASCRLPYPARLVAKLVLVIVAAVLLAVSGAPVWAVAFLVLAGVLVTIGELRERPVHSV